MCILVEFWLCSWKPSSKILGWLVLQNSWADIFHLWDVDSAQLELARSVIK